MDYKEEIRKILKEDTTIPPEQREKLKEVLLGDDEKIRKELLDYCKNKAEKYPNDPKYKNISAWITWLEKQCQVKESTEIQHDNKMCKENDDSLTSEDERIGKDIISFLRSKNGYMTPNEDWDFHNRWLPWLEKQGNKPQSKSALEAIHEQKADNANKIEIKPDFEVGDWVVDEDDNSINQIKRVVENVTSGKFSYDLVGGGYFPSTKKNYHLWTIADAKDGDVLVFKNNIGGIIICKSPTDYDTRSYCRIVSDNLINKEESGWDSTLLVPATKEQRGTLMKAITDAGYTFDFNKKELKKIENPTDWSEEDEVKFRDVIRLIEQGAPAQSIRDHYISWLKSLKQRVTWKPTEEQMMYLNKAIDDFDLCSEEHDELLNLWKDLKKLKD